MKKEKKIGEHLFTLIKKEKCDIICKEKRGVYE
jgi:hypothetical protein